MSETDGFAPLGSLFDVAVYVAPSATISVPKPTTDSAKETAAARTQGVQDDSAMLPVLQDDGPVARERRRSCTEATQRFIHGIGDFNLRDNHAQVMIEVRSKGEGLINSKFHVTHSVTPSVLV